MAKFRFAAALLLGGVLVGNLPAEQARGPANVAELRSRAVVNWSAPLYWSPGSGNDGSASIREKSTTAAPPNALPFVAIPPCRLADTRDASYPPGFGPPSLAGGNPPRTFTLPGRCGLPSEAAAYSLNVTVIPPANPPFSYLSVFPTGVSQPPVSTLNWGTGGTSNVYFNAAIVPAGTGGAIDVFVSSGTDLVLDVNGYYANDLTSQNGQFSLTSNVGGGGTLVVHNTNASGLPSWGGEFSTDACDDGSAGLSGIGTSGGCNGGRVYGLLGTSYGTNHGATGVYGQAVSVTSNNTFGVKGYAFSSNYDAAGVKGQGGWGDPLGDDQDCTPCYTAGVRGVNNNGNTHTAYGVLGISESRGTGGVLLATDNSTVLASGYLGFDNGSGHSYGVYSSGDVGGTGAKYFVEPHPRDASKVIRYVALEGPEAGTYFRGSAETRAGTAIIQVPESFRFVTEADGLTVQLTPVGELATLAVVSQDLNQIVVRSSQDVRFHYQVHGVRHGYANYEAITVSSEFAPEKADARIPATLTEAEKRSLISNGTYNPDGTINLETARALGWDQRWQIPPRE
jgi:hypothetical protein